jgi:predicted transcriptional regulator
MKRRNVDSEAIRSVGYDRRRQLLEVEFEGGYVYRYFAVPDEVFKTMMAADSMGTWFNQTFKSLRFQYEQLN